MKNLLISLILFCVLSIWAEPTNEPAKDKPAIDQSKIAVSVPGPGGGLGDSAWGNSFEGIRDQINKIRQNPDVKEKILAYKKKQYHIPIQILQKAKNLRKIQQKQRR